MSESAKPVAQVRRGVINAAVWKNTNSKAVYFSVTFERRYRDDEGAWQSTQSFGRDDLLVIAQVASHAFDTICQLQDQERQAQRDSGGQKESPDEEQPAPPPPETATKKTAAAAASVVKRSSR